MTDILAPLPPSCFQPYNRTDMILTNLIFLFAGIGIVWLYYKYKKASGEVVASPSVASYNSATSESAGLAREEKAGKSAVSPSNPAPETAKNKKEMKP